MLSWVEHENSLITSGAGIDSITLDLPSKIPKGKKAALKATALQSKHYKQTPKKNQTNTAMKKKKIKKKRSGLDNKK